jgi:hypothetical protein
MVDFAIDDSALLWVISWPADGTVVDYTDNMKKSSTRNWYWKTITWLIDWLYNVLRPSQEIFTYMETSPSPVKGCEIKAYARRSRPLSREGSLSCLLWHVTSVFPVSSEGPPHSVAFSTHKVMWRMYSNLDPHGYLINIMNTVQTVKPKVIGLMEQVESTNCCCTKNYISKDSIDRIWKQKADNTVYDCSR